MPLLLLVMINVYVATPNMVIIACLLLISMSLSFIPRFALLGVSDVRNVFLLDIVGNCLKACYRNRLLCCGASDL